MVEDKPQSPVQRQREFQFSLSQRAQGPRRPIEEVQEFMLESWAHRIDMFKPDSRKNT